MFNSLHISKAISQKKLRLLILEHRISLALLFPTIPTAFQKKPSVNFPKWGIHYPAICSAKLIHQNFVQCNIKLIVSIPFLKSLYISPIPHPIWSCCQLVANSFDPKKSFAHAGSLLAHPFGKLPNL